MKYEESILQNAQDEKWENIYRVSELLDSFFTVDEDGKMHLVQDYISNPVKSVHYKFHSFFGSKDAFEKMTYGELEDGVGELNNFLHYGDFESLVKLFAIFYKKKNEKYSKIDIDKRVKFFEHLDIRYIYGFYLLFVSFFNYLTKECVIVVDGKELDLRILFAPAKDTENDSSNENEPENLGLRTTSFQLAESGVFGTLTELRETDATLVLIRLYDIMRRNQKEEKERKEMEENSKTQS